MDQASPTNHLLYLVPLQMTDQVKAHRFAFRFQALRLHSLRFFRFRALRPYSLRFFRFCLPREITIRTASSLLHDLIVLSRQLLHLILAKIPHARSHQFLDVLQRFRLAHRNQRDLFRIPAGSFRRRIDPFPDRRVILI